MNLEARKRGILASVFGLGVVAGLFAGMEHVGDIDLPPWAHVSFLVVMLVAAGAFSLVWWRLLDEVAREAHKFAWYWGASGGIIVASAIMLLVKAERIAPPLVMGSDVSDIFAAGAVTVLLSQLAGYVIAWVGWWWSRR